MAHIVGIWEIGGSLGHIARFAALVPHWRRQGHQVTLVLRDLSQVERFPALRRARLMQAPLWLPRAHAAPERPASLPEILEHFGYRSETGLQAMVRAWRDTLAALRPDLLLFDYAPTALMATHKWSVPRATQGHGFSIPPARSPMPSFRTPDSDEAERMAASEARVTRTVQRVLEQLDGRAPETLGELFAVDEDFLCTVGELDPYTRAEPTRYWGALYEANTGRSPRWSSNGRPRIAGYLKPTGAFFDTCLDAIHALGCEANLFVPGAARALLQRHESERVRISTRAFAMEKLVAGCDLLISHGSHNTAFPGLLAGKPAFQIPLQMEQWVLTRRVREQGLGESVIPGEESKLRDGLEQVLTEPDYTNAAQAFAHRHVNAGPAQTIPGILSRCEELLSA